MKRKNAIPNDSFIHTESSVKTICEGFGITSLHEGRYENFIFSEVIISLVSDFLKNSFDKIRA